MTTTFSISCLYIHIMFCISKLNMCFRWSWYFCVTHSAISLWCVMPNITWYSNFMRLIHTMSGFMPSLMHTKSVPEASMVGWGPIVSFLISHCLFFYNNKPLPLSHQKMKKKKRERDEMSKVTMEIFINFENKTLIVIICIY